MRERERERKKGRRESVMWRVSHVERERVMGLMEHEKGVQEVEEKGVNLSFDSECHEVDKQNVGNLSSPSTHSLTHSLPSLP